MISAIILSKGVRENDETVIETAIDVQGSRTNVRYEMAALLECLWDVDEGKTLSDAMVIHQMKLLSQIKEGSTNE